MKAENKRLVKDYQLQLLKNKVLEKFGKPDLNIPGSYQLSEAVLRDTGHRLSVSTLQRFFGLVKGNTLPYPSTLDILSHFSGFQNWDNFLKHFDDRPSLQTKRGSLLPDENGLALVQICLNNQHFASVVEYLDVLPSKYSVPYKDEYYIKQVKISNVLGHYIRKNPHGRRKLIPLLAQSARGREYFFETFVDIDYCNDYYADSLNFYLKNALPFNTMEGRSESMFAKGIQLLQHLENKDKKKMARAGHELFKSIPIKEANLDYCRFSQPLARYYALLMVYHHFSNNLTGKLLDKILDTMQDMIDQRECKDFTMMYTLYGLHYCCRYDELVKFYLHNLDWFLNVPNIYETVPLTHAFAFHAFNQKGIPFPVGNLSDYLIFLEPVLISRNFNYVNQKIKELVIL